MAPRLESQVLTLPVNDEETIRLVSLCSHGSQQTSSSIRSARAIELVVATASSKAQPPFSDPFDHLHVRPLVSAAR